MQCGFQFRAAFGFGYTEAFVVRQSETVGRDAGKRCTRMHPAVLRKPETPEIFVL